MKLRSKETFWLLKNGLVNTYPSLQKNITCDVLVIGGGITGSLMAYQFSQEGYQTVLIDKRDVAMGSTSATTAMLQYEIDEPLYKLIDKVGEAAAVESYRAGVTAIDSIGKITQEINSPCGFKKKSSLYFAESEKDRDWLEKEFNCRKGYDFEVLWITSAQLKDRFGIYGEGAILSEAGASLDAYMLAHSLLEYSVGHYGLEVYDHTHAKTVEYQHDNNIVITENDRAIRCRWIIYASGYETQQMLKDKIVNLNSTYALVSEPLPEIPPSLEQTIFWNTESPYLYFRTTSDNRILAGGGDERFKNASRRDSLIDKKENFLVEKMKKIIPNLTLTPDFTWAGTFGVTKDSLPYIGPHPDYPNSYFILGFGGNGITFSIMGMKILSDALRGQPNRFLEYYRFGR